MTKAPRAIVAADSTATGSLDLSSANNLSNNVSILAGDGKGSFARTVNSRSAHCPLSLALADFNGDGRLDIATANAKSRNVSMLIGDGRGGFAVMPGAANIPTGIEPFHIASGDFNRDGKRDLAVANSGSSSVSLFEGDGRGGFAPPVSYAAGVTPIALAVADFDGDNELDLATVNHGSNNLIARAWRGARTLGGGTQFHAVAVAALRHDG